MPALDPWKSLGVKALQCSITGVRFSYFILPDLKYTGGGEPINNLNSSLVNHHGKLTRLNVWFHTAGAK